MLVVFVTLRLLPTLLSPDWPRLGQAKEDTKSPPGKELKILLCVMRCSLRSLVNARCRSHFLAHGEISKSFSQNLLEPPNDFLSVGRVCFKF